MEWDTRWWRLKVEISYLLRCMKRGGMVWWCAIFHRKCFGDDTWEVVRLPEEGVVEPGALWRVWCHCRKCGRGWTKKVEQLGSGSKWIRRSKPLPIIADAVFIDPAKKGEGNEVEQEMVDSKDGN